MNLTPEQEQWLIEAKEDIKKACDICGLAMYPSVVFNNRLRVTAGRAWFPKCSIDLSLQLWTRMTREDRLQTTVHEACHVISYMKTRFIGHNKYWKHYMIKCGLKPLRCHKYNTKGLKNKVKRYDFICGCGLRKGILTKKIATKIITHNLTALCNTCNEKIIFPGYVLSELKPKAPNLIHFPLDKPQFL